MKTTSPRVSAGSRWTKRQARRPKPAHSSDIQVFQMSLKTILCAHSFGHLDDAYALRAIARAMKESFLDDGSH